VWPSYEGFSVEMGGWRDAGNRSISAQRKQLQIEYHGERWIMVQFFSQCFSGQEASGPLLCVLCPLKTLVWPVLSSVLGTGWVRCLHGCCSTVKSWWECCFSFGLLNKFSALSQGSCMFFPSTKSI